MGHGSQYNEVMGTRVLHQCNRFTCVVSVVRGGVCKAADSSG